MCYNNILRLHMLNLSAKKVDPKFFVQTFLGGGGFNPQNPPSDYGPDRDHSFNDDCVELTV